MRTLAARGEDHLGRAADAVEYLLEARDNRGSIVARDTSLATLRVL